MFPPPPPPSTPQKTIIILRVHISMCVQYYSFTFCMQRENLFLNGPYPINAIISGAYNSMIM